MMIYPRKKQINEMTSDACPDVTVSTLYFFNCRD